MMIFLDEKLLSGSRESVAQLFMSDIESFGGIVQISDIPGRNKNSRQEFIVIAGLGIAVFSLIISYLRLDATKKDVIDSPDKLKKEIEAVLQLHGETSYTFDFADGIDNIMKKNGMPCLVVVTLHGEVEEKIYFGATRDRLWVSRVEPDWRKLN